MKSCPIQPREYAREINEQRIENKLCKNTNSNNNPVVKNKDKYNIDYFHAGPERNADMKAIAELKNEFRDAFTGLGVQRSSINHAMFTL